MKNTTFFCYDHVESCKQILGIISESIINCNSYQDKVLSFLL